MENTKSQRLKQIVDFLKLKNSEVAEILDIDSSAVSNILSGRRNVSQKTIEKISKWKPEINIEWLLSGRGTMLKPESVGERKYKPPDLPEFWANLAHIESLGLLTGQGGYPPPLTDTLIRSMLEGLTGVDLEVLLALRQHTGLALDDLLFMDLTNEELMEVSKETYAATERSRAEKEAMMKAIQELRENMENLLQERAKDLARMDRLEQRLYRPKARKGRRID
jgi:transcriptional regulator with XRE-family HTH domain